MRMNPKKIQAGIVAAATATAGAATIWTAATSSAETGTQPGLATPAERGVPGQAPAPDDERDGARPGAEEEEGGSQPQPGVGADNKRPQSGRGGTGGANEAQPGTTAPPAPKPKPKRHGSESPRGAQPQTDEQAPPQEPQPNVSPHLPSKSTPNVVRRSNGATHEDVRVTDSSGAPIAAASAQRTGQWQGQAIVKVPGQASQTVRVDARSAVQAGRHAQAAAKPAINAWNKSSTGQNVNRAVTKAVNDANTAARSPQGFKAGTVTVRVNQRQGPIVSVDQRRTPTSRGRR